MYHDPYSSLDMYKEALLEQYEVCLESSLPIETMKCTGKMVDTSMTPLTTQPCKEPQKAPKWTQKERTKAQNMGELDFSATARYHYFVVP